MHIAQQDIEITIGEYFTLDVTVVDENDLPVNLSGYSAYLPVKVKYGETGAPLVTATGTYATVTGNIVSFPLSPSQTALLPCVQGVYEVILVPTVSNPIVYLYGYAEMGPSLI